MALPNTVVNPELEKIRSSVEPEDVTPSYQEILSSCRHIHASYLFHPYGHKALKEICTVVSSVPSSVHYNSWKDLASRLGLTYHQIECIGNYKDDFTELTLKAFAQKPDATIEMIVQGLKEIERFDALVCAKPYLLNLAEKVEKEHEVLEDVDSGYLSLNEETRLAMKIAGLLLKPKGKSNMIRDELPITLKEIGKIQIQPDIIKPHSPCIENSFLQTATPITRKKKPRVCSRRVLLTFAGDGLDIAKEAAKILRQPRGTKLPIGVVILNEHPDKVMSNPQKFIRDAFMKVDYVIPILTEEYITLTKHDKSSTLPATPIDARFVHLIYDLMSNYYTNNNCLNYKVRCLIPNQLTDAILANPLVRFDPLFNVFFRMSEIEKLAAWMLKMTEM